jgi:ketosteroid isomerase-like protein
MNHFTTTCLWCLFIISHSSCNRQPAKYQIDPAIEKAFIVKTIHNSIGWARNKNFQLLYNTIANDSNYIEVDPNPGLIKGINEFRKNEAFWSNPDFKAIRYEIRDLVVNLSNSGDVAWFYCMLDDINEWKGKPANWENTRWTGVLEKREGRWQIVQMHFSFASK